MSTRHELVINHRQRLLSCSKQYRVSIATSVFEVYMLQVKVKRRNHNFYVIIYNMIKLIMLHIYNTIKLDAIKAFVIIFDMIKLILLCIHLKRSSNE